MCYHYLDPRKDEKVDIKFGEMQYNVYLRTQIGYE